MMESIQDFRSNLPITWEVKKLEEVISIEKGKKPSNLEDLSINFSIPYINIKAFEKKIISQFTDGEKCTFADEDDILIVWDGARCGLVGTGIKGAVGSTLAKLISNGIHKKYLYYFLQSQFCIY